MTLQQLPVRPWGTQWHREPTQQLPERILVVTQTKPQVSDWLFQIVWLKVGVSGCPFWLLLQLASPWGIGTSSHRGSAAISHLCRWHCHSCGHRTALGSSAVLLLVLWYSPKAGLENRTWGLGGGQTGRCTACPVAAASPALLEQPRH